MSGRLPDPIHLPEPHLRGGPGPARADELIRVFKEIKRAVKQMAFNRHRREDFAQWMAPAHQALELLLASYPLEIKLEVSTLVCGDVEVLLDDARELNVVYPLWQEGVRLLVMKPGLTVEELIRFYAIVCGIDPGDPTEDLLTRLWKEEFQHLDWVVMTDYSVVEGQEAEEVEVEVEKVLAYLHRELQSETSKESISFARVSLDDLDLKLENVSQLRRTRVEGEVAQPHEREQVQAQLTCDEARLLEKICGIVFQAMELPVAGDEHDDINAAFEQLLDGLILEGKFGTIEKVLLRLEQFARRGDLPTQNRELCRSCGEKLQTLMHEGQRIRAVGTALNSGQAKNLDGVKAYLVRLGPTATVQLLDLLDGLNGPHHRRLVADALVEVGRHGVTLFANRLSTSSSNLAKDLLYIIDRINPPNKLELFAEVLRHENAVLRMEGLTAIGRNQTQRCYELIKSTFLTHQVPQMRAHAARILAGYPAEWGAVKVLLEAARAESFDQRPDGEKRAILGALARIEHDDARGYLQSVFQEKSGLLNKRRVDDRKLMAISALSTVPSIPTLQFLANVAKDAKLHSKEVMEAARLAALAMKNRILQSGSEGGA